MKPDDEWQRMRAQFRCHARRRKFHLPAGWWFWDRVGVVLILLAFIVLLTYGLPLLCPFLERGRQAVQQAREVLR